MPYAYTPTFDEPATKRMADEAKEQLDEIMRRLGDESGVEIDAQIVVEPRIGPAILDFARVHDIDVIAMSTHGRGMSRFLLGGVADKVLRGSGLPMLLYRPSGVQARVHIVETSADADAPAVTHT
jgi:nucleotide-binding universal stress UspA family protein